MKSIAVSWLKYQLQFNGYQRYLFVFPDVYGIENCLLIKQLLVLHVHVISRWAEALRDRVLSTALAKNHAKPANGDTSPIKKINNFQFFQ